MSYSYSHLRHLAVTAKKGIRVDSRSLQYLFYEQHTNFNRCKSSFGIESSLFYDEKRCRSYEKLRPNKRITQNQTQGTREISKDFFLFESIRFKSDIVSLNSGSPSGWERNTSRVKRSLSDGFIMTESQLVVAHDQIKNFFYITLGENASNSGATAKLEYAWLSSDLVDMYHTEVPSEFRGQGVAKILAKAAFDHFSEKNVQMRPTCTYLQNYLKDNPISKYLDHVEKNFK